MRPERLRKLMFYKITLPVRMNRKSKDILGLEVTEEKLAHLMVTDWDGKILGVIMATQPTEDRPEQVKTYALRMIQNVIGTNTNDYFELQGYTIEPIKAAQFMNLILDFGRKYPRYDNGDNPNHNHLFTMYMHQRFDFATDLIKQNVSRDLKELNLPFDQIPADFDFKIPILLVSTNPLISHLFARELRLRYRKITGKPINGIYVTTVSPYERLLDYASALDPETIASHPNQIMMINFNVEDKHPLAVDLFDTYIIPRIIELAKQTLVILVSDNPYVYKHYKYVRMLRINLNERIGNKPV